MKQRLEKLLSEKWVMFVEDDNYKKCDYIK